MTRAPNRELWTRRAGLVALLALACFISGKAGLALPYFGSQIPLAWFPAGIAVATLLRWGWQYWPGVWLGAVFLKLSESFPLGTAVIVASSNTAGPLLAAWALRRAGFRPEFDRLRDVGLFFVLVPLGMTVVATGALVGLCLAGTIPWDSFPNAWVVWWLADTAGVLLVAPAVLTFRRSFLERVRREWRQSSLLGVVAVGVGWAAFFRWSSGTSSTAAPLIFLCVPVMVWAVVRFEAPGAAWTSLLLGAFATFATARGYGPFYDTNLHHGLLLMWSFVGTAPFVGFLLTPLQSERRRAEAALERSEEHLRLAISAAPIGTWEWNIQTGEMYCSENLRTMFGMGGQAAPPGFESFTQAVHPEDRLRVLEALRQAVEENAPYHLERRLLLPDGSVRWTQTHGQVLRDASGQPRRLVGVDLDITARKNEEARTRQARKLEAVGTLAGGIAHDFNNILGAILGNVELARQDVGPDHCALEALDEIEKAGLRGKGLVQHLMAFSRQREVRKENIQLRPIIERTCQLLQRSLPPGVELVTEFIGEAPDVFADPMQIQEMLQNLCTNASHALAGKPGWIKVELAGTHLDANSPTNPEGLRAGFFARLSVTDSGGGMDAATLERIFEPFFTTKPPGQGSGLGLSAVHGIIKEHAGAVTATSEPGKGTTFQLLFPAVSAPRQSSVPASVGRIPPAATTPAESVPVLTDGPVSGHGGGTRLLYLDDDESLVMLTAKLLQYRGYRVTGFTRPSEALAALRADPMAFDLVVTDYNMPGDSGALIAQEIRAIRPDLPVALASGYLDAEMKQSAAHFGVRHVLEKPSSLEEWCDAVHRLALSTQQSAPPTPAPSPRTEEKPGADATQHPAPPT